jgi:imidazolonepropionase
VDHVVESLLPAVAAGGLADAVDAFCERIAFTPAQCERVLAAARAHGLPVKLHADQLSDLGGAALAARLGALSADHLEYTSEAGVAAMGAAGTVAVLLPGAFYTLRETRLPPVDALRRHGVPIAVATDCNPGSSPLQSPLLAMNLACTLFRLTPAEAFAGFTVHAARALGLQREIGAIAPGLRADLALWDVGRPAELAYAMGAAPLVARWYGGVRG